MRNSLPLALLFSLLIPLAVHAEEVPTANPDSPPSPTPTATESATEPPAADEPFPEHSAEEEIAALRPVLIGQRYLDETGRRLAVQLARSGRKQDDPQGWFADNALVAREFVGDVRIIYLLDFQEGTQLVSQGMMKSWGMDRERLHQQALANLDRESGDLTIKPVGKLPWLNVLDTADGFAASRLLLHWRWAEVTLRLGEVLILGMPTRDVVVFTATTDAAKLQQLRETVATVERYQGRPISRRLFQWTPQGWVEFAPGSEQAMEQDGERAEQQGAGEGEAMNAAAPAPLEVPGQPALAEDGRQPGQAEAGHDDDDQPDDEPLQHGQ